jgi:ubiquinone/menaquinone biosynthesis C-methylase UbiE
VGFELDPEIAAHYGQGLEGARLAGSGRVEAARTWELLMRFLPPPPAVVIDVGGAEGAYALPLAREGYHVHVLDPVAAHVDAARAASAAQPSAPLASAVLGDARDLPFTEEVADAVLLLGPLYHLIDREDRATALSEARRVLRAGGILLAAAISRFASTLDGLHSGAIRDPAFEAIVAADVRDGVHRNPDVEGRPEWFTLAYFHTPDDLREEVRGGGFADVDVLAVEGLASRADLNAALDDAEQRARVLRAIARVEREPSVLGASMHLMAIARKP